MPSWSNLTRRDLPASSHSSVICPIVKSSSQEGGNWINLPTGIVLNKNFGWNQQDNSITVLNTTALQSFDINDDAPDFNLLFSKESTSQERLFMTRADTSTNTTDSAFNRVTALNSIVERLIVNIRLVSTDTYKDPDTSKYNVLVYVVSNGVISGGEQGILIPKDEAPARCQAKLSVRGILNAN